MQEPVSEKQSAVKKSFRRAWFWMLFGLLLLTVLFSVTLPVGIDHGIERYLKDQGADQVSLEDVDFNPITGRMVLTNLSVIIDAQTVSKILQATVDIEWIPFFRKRFVLKRMRINDAQITVQAFGDGRWQIGGIQLPKKSEPSEPSTWNFGLEKVSFENSTIKFSSPQLASELKIEQATITKLSSWLPERKARMELEGQLNDSRLQLQVDIAPFGDDINADGQIKLKNLSLTPFAQLIKPRIDLREGRLNADLKFEFRQTADGSFSHQQKGRLGLQKISTSISGTDFSVDDLTWNGIVRLDSPGSEKAMKINADGQLVGSRLSSTSDNETRQIQQDSIDWKGKIGYARSPAASDLNLDGVLAAGDTNISGPQLNLSEEKLYWKGVVNLSKPNANADTHITSDGEFKLGPLTLNLLEQKAAYESAGLEWQGKLDFVRNQTDRKISANGQIRVADLKIVSPQSNLAEEMLRWQGAIEFSSDTANQGSSLLADGALDNSRLRLNLIDRKLKFEHEGLSWKGRLDSGKIKDFSAAKADADVLSNGIQILHSETGRPLFETDRIHLQGIRVDGLSKINAAKVTLNGLALLADPKSSPTAEPSLLRIQQVLLSDMRLSQQNNLAIDSIRFNELKAYVNRDAEGKWPAIDRWNAAMDEAFSADRKQRNASGKDADKKSDTFDYRIGQIDITGDSKFRFKDEGVQPAFDIDLNIIEARLSHLDSRRSKGPATVQLLVSDANNARLSLDGTLQAPAGQLQLDWVGKIKAFELPSFSPYVIESTGYRFTSGELKADVPLEIAQNKLKGEIDLTLYNPKIKRVETANSQTPQEGKIQLNMTLPSALKLLRDKQNNVKIKIPISGDINDPQFSVADAVNQVLAKTLQKSALSYLKFALGPYGIGITVAELAYKQAFKIRLNPILFAPGSAELDEAATDYLQRVAAIMKEYPTVQVSVCGVATESDRTVIAGSPSIGARAPATGQEAESSGKKKTDAEKEPAASQPADAALLGLAENRTERIEKHLVDMHEIAADRIIACKPEIDTSTAASPRAKLEI